jgi:hypothetical protein
MNALPRECRSHTFENREGVGHPRGSTLPPVFPKRDDRTRLSSLVQPGVLGLGLLQDGNVGIRIFPKGEKVLI